jgi:predicted nucleic acid-binding protein
MGFAEAERFKEMSAIVCDASVLFKLAVPEPESALAKGLVASSEVFVPDLAYAEIGNAMWAYMRRTGIGLTDAEGLLDLLDEAPVSVCPIRPYLRRALSIAATLKHPIYDCVYLALAESLGVELVTADQRFLSALRRVPLTSAPVKALADVA